MECAPMISLKMIGAQKYRCVLSKMRAVVIVCERQWVWFAAGPRPGVGWRGPRRGRGAGGANAGASCLAGGVPTAAEPHGGRVAGRGAAALPRALRAAPVVLGRAGLPPRRHRGLGHGQGQERRAGQKVCVPLPLGACAAPPPSTSRPVLPRK